MRRGRFAPTPSGMIHLGNARTALLAWLQMRAVRGEFILRVEDIDIHRSKPHIAEQIIDDLYWLGIDWDEGPDVGGSYGPYRQSERQHLYEQALLKLSQGQYLYPCYCSRAQLLSVASAPHGIASEGPAYNGQCRSLTTEQRLVKAADKVPSLRFKTPEGNISFADQIAGLQSFSASYGGDFIVKRADGIISYQLAVVVDDAAMGITDVLRGWDLLDSTPRQLLLYKALGLNAPSFAHVPLLYGPDGQRLAKRHGAIALHSIRAQGISPEKVVGYLAYMSGLIPKPEPVKASELIEHFEPKAVSTTPFTLNEQILEQLLL
ncbi:tRNA glutamyl-Q(34) synthetase GluQRS [Paenibacillus sediminis]|uniref:Glutamyl-Q tRNA(Asp) synthetase n=1 Tax=Paenibacillus sediminis TaxID=664909 RepID=A0ABS4H1B3_9BACL|nr:tRNA glutamyl-Q(34) synthetase GluQRS [Paenibacillus sediminis]MBP1936314.1 glutamyl-tRNA synthetase [Paenibacillus sediminis]